MLRVSFQIRCFSKPKRIPHHEGRLPQCLHRTGTVASRFVNFVVPTRHSPKFSVGQGRQILPLPTAAAYFFGLSKSPASLIRRFFTCSISASRAFHAFGSMKSIVLRSTSLDR